MTVAPGFRAVVFALRDLPPSDKSYLADVARALRWPPEREPALWETPLLLGRQSDTPPVPGLRSDDEVAASGPSVLLLAMRLLLADALQWPELRFLGLDLHHDAPDYVLYAADPARWTPASLADALADGGSTVTGTAAVTTPSWQIQRGLQPPTPRLPPVPGDRVPVLGLQVPLFGGQLRNLRDLRPLPERLRAPVGSPDLSPLATVAATPDLPAGAVAGHHQGGYALYLRFDSLFPSRSAESPSEEADDAQVDLKLFRVTTATGAIATAELRLLARDLSILYDAESDDLTPAALSDWLAELLPSCFLVAPTGEVLLLDWFGLDLTLRPEPTAAAPQFDLRSCGRPGAGDAANPGDHADQAELSDPALLDPTLWSLPVYAELLAAADLTLSATGRYLLIESAIPLDGELSYLSALLDTTAGPRTLCSDLADEESPPPARITDDRFPVLRGERAAPGAIA
jgi:hypothetical protein